ncbi:MAG: TolC family protein [Rhodothermales bacterium]|nr:TolC family protein [Rhodothermales bacterium]
MLYRCPLRLLKAFGLVFVVLVIAAPRVGYGQFASISPLSPREPITLTLEEALQIAYIQNYAMKDARLGVEEADAQVKEGYGQLYPQIEASSSYTRNLKSANPFSGSSAGNLFSSLGFIDWLAYNERSRTDEDPGTDPLTFDDFIDRQQEGIDRAGIILDAQDNPFAVPNQFQSGITITQKIFDFSAFIAVKGASRYLTTGREYGLKRQEQVMIDEVRAAFYQALLAQESIEVARQSVGRTGATLSEISRQVTQGVTPKFQRLSMEVELANLETALLQTSNRAEQAFDQLKVVVGIPVDQPLHLVGQLAVDSIGEFQTISMEDAVGVAIDQRPDLDQLRESIKLQQLNARVTRSSYLPTLNAFANFSYVGNVPGNRTFLIADADDPFTFSQGSNSFFSSSYWNPAINVGFQLRWRLFDGFQSRYRAQQATIAADRLEVQFDQQLQGVRQEVALALRNLEAARMQIASQERNSERAALNYAYAGKRLEEGVATPLEVRNVSDQLDQSRLNHLQAIHDYLRARSAFETAVGMPLANSEELNLALARWRE